MSPSPSGRDSDPGDALSLDDAIAVAALTHTIWAMVEMDAVGATPEEADVAFAELDNLDVVELSATVFLGTATAIVGGLVRELADATGRTPVEVIDALHHRGRGDD